MESIDISKGLSAAMKHEILDFMEEMQKINQHKFDKMKAALSETVAETLKETMTEAIEKQNNKIDAFKNEFELVKKDLISVQKSVSDSQKEAKSQSATLKLELSKCKENNLKTMKDLETKTTATTNTTTSLQTNIGKLEKQIKDFEKNQNVLQTQLNALKSELKKAEDSCKKTNEKTQKDIIPLKSGVEYVYSEVSPKLKALDFQVYSISEPEDKDPAIDWVVKHHPIITEFYKKFPSGMCYNKTKYEEQEAIDLYYPKLKNIYSLRLSKHPIFKVKKPFEIKIGSKRFLVTEYHNIVYVKGYSATFYIVPEIFENVSALFGYEFLLDYPVDSKFIQSRLEYK